MGSNIHIVRYPKDVPRLKEFPESLDMGDSSTCPRYVDSFKFMQAVWEDDEFRIRCFCREDECEYMCDGNSVCRPKDFVRLREATKELQPVFQELIDYLESEPNAWLEYD